jgi:hypothetical protein
MANEKKDLVPVSEALKAMRSAPATTQAEARVARRAAPVAMLGIEIGGRLFCLEAMMIVLVEAYLDRPEVKDDKIKSMLSAMRENAIAISRQMNRPELEVQTTKAIDEMIDILVRNMPQMKGEFGIIRDAATSN